MASHYHKNISSRVNISAVNEAEYALVMSSEWNFEMDDSFFLYLWPVIYNDSHHLETDVGQKDEFDSKKL